MTPRWYNIIDPYEALELRKRGWSWHQVGVALARRQGRDIKYQPESIRKAIYNERKKRRERLS